MDRNPDSATAAGATDRGAVVLDIVADTAIDSAVVAAEATAVAVEGSSAAVATPDDSARLAVVAHAANYAAARCCRGRDRNAHPCFGHVPTAGDAGILVAVAADDAARLAAVVRADAVALSCGCTVVADDAMRPDAVVRADAVAPSLAAVVAVANAAHAPATRGFGTDVAEHCAVRAPAIGVFVPDAAEHCAVVVSAVPNAVAVPGCSAVAAGVAVPSAVAAPDYFVVAPAGAVLRVAAVALVGRFFAVAELLPVLAGGFVALVVAVAGVARAGPGFPASAPRPDRVVPGRWRGHSLPATRRISPKTILIGLGVSLLHTSFQY